MECKSTTIIMFNKDQQKLTITIIISLLEHMKPRTKYLVGPNFSYVNLQTAPNLGCMYTIHMYIY